MQMWRNDNAHGWRGWWKGVIERKDRHRHRIVITIIVVVIIILIDIDIIIDVSTSSLSTPTSTTPHRPSLRRGSSRVSATHLSCPASCNLQDGTESFTALLENPRTGKMRPFALKSSLREQTWPPNRACASDPVPKDGQWFIEDQVC